MAQNKVVERVSRRVFRRVSRTSEPTLPLPDHRPCLLTSRRDRDDWQGWLSRALRTRSASRILATHSNARKLADGITFGTYLRLNPDVADTAQSPVEATFHYLEFGVAEGRLARPTHVDNGFIARYHGHVLPDHLSPTDAVFALQKAGIAITEIALEERDFWCLHGLHHTLADIFHHETYFAAIDAASLPLPAPDRLSCIRHFVGVGLDHGLPPHPDDRLDPAFYRASLADLSLPCPPGSLHRHWASIGLRAGAHANAAACLRHAHGLHLPAELPKRLPAQTRSAGAIARLISRPEPHLPLLDPTHPDLRRFLLDLARHARQSGHRRRAEALLAHILCACPDDPRAALDLADLIHGQDDIDREVTLRQIPPVDFDSGANAITLAELHLSKGRVANALDLLDALPDAHRGDVALHSRARQVARGAFDHVWSNLDHHIAIESVPAVQRLLTLAITAYAPPPTAAPRPRPLRNVAILANDDLYQCKLYRADQKVDQLRAAGISARIYLQSRDVAALHADLDQFDAVIFQRNPAFPQIADVMLETATRGLPTFYDIDDLIFDAAQFPPPLADYAGQITATDHARIACGVPLFAAAAALCTTGIASTETIRAALAPLTVSGTAIHHPNGLGGLHNAAMAHCAPRDADGKLILFYGSGTKAHKGEFREILEPALAQILATYPGQVALHLMGDFPDLVHLDPAHPDVHIIAPVWDFEVYAQHLSKADIALSVLAPSKASDAKSEIKWMEPAMFAIPSVVSPTRTMQHAIVDGETGFLAADTKAFTDFLSRLIEDAPLRRRVGRAAQADVLHKYGCETLGPALARAMAPPPQPDKIRLLVANVFFPPQDIGGATRVVADNIDHIQDHYGDAFQIDVITTLEGGTSAHGITRTTRDETQVWAVTAANGVDEGAMRDPVMDARLEAIFDRVDPQIVHIHCMQRMGVGLIDICRRRGVPYVLTLHDGWWTSPHQFIVGPDGTPALYDFTDPQSERAKIAHRCLRDASALVSVSDPFADLHRAVGLRDITVIENGVSPLPARKRTPPAPGRVRLGLIGGAARHKGHDILRAAICARSFDNIDLVIVDHALPPGTQVQEVWNTTPVTRIPRRPQSEIGALYGSFDVLLAPSVWPESYGLVAREALAMGLWVVASDRGAIGADITEGANGHVVPVDDHRALANILARIDAAPERYAQPPAIIPALRSSADQAEDLVALYRRILGRGTSENEVVHIQVA
ncbi:glycosyltransferase [Hasllibacter sp. MH4015]|uniref:glycosyltransferase n=1 Tax=Hasllibacter sp. MH4015 TaxID=2854029 RepID=UPI001CD31543|nr:glycosyltransferase [Hasllibacter sp. MH4015]